MNQPTPRRPRTLLTHEITLRPINGTDHCYHRLPIVAKKDFDGFYRLIPEIQMYIWELALLADPRYIEISLERPDGVLPSDLKAHTKSTNRIAPLLYSITMVPALMHVCHQARVVALKFYKKLDDRLTQGITYINFNADILILSGTDDVEAVIQNSRIANYVRKVAIYEQVKARSNPNRPPRNISVELASNFPCLKEVYTIFPLGSQSDLKGEGRIKLYAKNDNVISGWTASVREARSWIVGKEITGTALWMTRSTIRAYSLKMKREAPKFKIQGEEKKLSEHVNLEKWKTVETSYEEELDSLMGVPDYDGESPGWDY